MAEEKKGLFVVEPGIAVSEFVEKINKLSYKQFPADEVLKLFQKDGLSSEYLEPYTFFSDVRYTRNLIHKTDDFELVLMCWNPGQKSPVGCLTGSATWFKIQKGMLQVTYYQEEPSTESKLVKKLDAAALKQDAVEAPSQIYQVENVSGNMAVSLQLFTPPHSQCDIYDLDSNEKKTVSLSYHSIHGKLVAPEDKR